MRPINRLSSMLHTKASKPNRKSVLDIYTQLAEIPIPVSAQFTSLGRKVFISLVRFVLGFTVLTWLVGVGSNLKATEIEVTYVVRDHLANRKRTMLKTIPLKLANEHGAKPASSKLLDTGDVVARVFSPSKELRADFRVDKNTFVPTRRIELWKEDQLIRSVDVSGYHGDFYTDGE